MRGGSGTRKFVHQKWPEKMFPLVNSFFPTMVTLVWGGGGAEGGGGVTPPPPMVYGHSNTALGAIIVHTASALTLPWGAGVALREEDED